MSCEYCHLAQEWDDRPFEIDYIISRKHQGLTVAENNHLKAYLATTGTIFALIAVLHVLRSIAEWSLLTTDPGHYLFMSGLGVVAAGLSVWAWGLFRRQIRM